MGEINSIREGGYKQNYSSLYIKLIALWVVCEAMIGGIIHGLKLPFSGLIVGGAAVVCITMIGYYIPAKGAILRATIIVAIFKMTLSPQAPATAYIAVFFQGFVGQLLFSGKRFFRIRAISLGALALAESAVQRILVLTLVYGTTFWKAVNEFMAKVIHQKGVTNYSLIIAVGYIILHILVGMLIGNYCYQLIVKVKENEQRILNGRNDRQVLLSVHEKSGKRYRPVLIFIYVVIAALYCQSLLHVGKPILPKGEVTQVLLRSSLILLSWYFVVAPLLLKWIKAILERRQAAFAKDIDAVMEVLPAMKAIVADSWSETTGLKGYNRIKAWSRKVLVATLTS
jgi:hypothetical protein